MILTADSAAARAANRRKTANGWNTSFIGKNRNTLKEGEAPPASGAPPKATCGCPRRRCASATRSARI